MSTDESSDQTQPRAAAIPGVRESVRPNRLFLRVSEVLDLNDAATASLIAPLMVGVDATPSTMTLEHVSAMRAGLDEIIEVIFPISERAAARARLAELLAE